MRAKILIILFLIIGNVSAYTTSPDETDSTPCFGAWGRWFNLCETEVKIVANNCIPFLTRVVIDGEVYFVGDRMNSRYSCEHFDILKKTKGEALVWGRKKVEVRHWTFPF